MNEERKPARVHGFTLESRQHMALRGVYEVERFDENVVLLLTENGPLRIDGRDLHVQKLDLESGQLVVDGQIDAAVYEKQRDARGLLERIFG